MRKDLHQENEGVRKDLDQKNGNLRKDLDQKIELLRRDANTQHEELKGTIWQAATAIIAIMLTALGIATALIIAYA